MKTKLEKVRSVCTHKPAWVCLSARVCGKERDCNKSITCRKYSFVSTKWTSEPEKTHHLKLYFQKSYAILLTGYQKHLDLNHIYSLTHFFFYTGAHSDKSFFSSMLQYQPNLTYDSDVAPASLFPLLNAGSFSCSKQLVFQ